MINSHKLALFALSILLVGILSLPPATALAGKVIVTKPGGHAVHKGKISILKRPAGYHAAPHHSGAVVVVPRTRYHRGVRVVRPYGHAHAGYGFYYTDNDAYKWLAFTAITLKILDSVNEEQQRLHEAAHVQASAAEVGETIIWEDGNASGSVKTTRIGTSTSNRQCREFQQSITIGGKTEQAYGTACLEPEGAWEVVQ